MAEGGKIRKDGKITTVPLAHYVRTIDFGDGKKCYERSVGRCIYSVLYNGYSKHWSICSCASQNDFGAKMMNCFRPVLKLNAVQKFIKSRIEKRLLDQMRNSARKYPPMFGEKQEIHVGK